MIISQEGRKYCAKFTKINHKNTKNTAIRRNLYLGLTFHIVRDIIIKSQACACRIWRYSSVGESNRFIPGGSLVRILLPLLHGPLVKRLRLQIFILATWVRFPYGSSFQILGNSEISQFPRFSFMVKICFVRYLSAIAIL